MSDPLFFLASSTRAIANADGAVHLIEQKERVEQAVVRGDAALALDTSKAFLETIFKTILSDRLPNCDLEQDLNPLFKCVKSTLQFNRDEAANTMLEKLTGSVVHNIGELRNKFGAASHGKDGYHENPIELADAELIARLVDGVAGFVFHKHKANLDPSSAVRIFYQDYPEFNDFWDSQYEGYIFQLDDTRKLEILPSKLLFQADPDALAYREMLLQYRSTEIEDAEIDDEDATETEINENKIPAEIIEPTNLVQPLIPAAEGAKQIHNAILSKYENASVEDSENLFTTSTYIAEYAVNDAGVDWQNRDSLRAAFRTYIRRQLGKIIQTDDLLQKTTEAALEKAAEIYPSQMGALP